MSERLKQVDKSKNMEDLRSARSYNDVVVVLSRIKTSTSSILSSINRKLSKVQPQPVEIGIKEGAEFSVDRKALESAHNDLEKLLSCQYALQFARSLTSVIANDSKMDKFRKLCELSDVTIIKAQNAAYKYLDTVGSAVEPNDLRKYANSMDKLLSKMLKFYKQSTFVVPTADDKISFIRNIVLHNVTTPNSYVLPEFIVSLHADNNFDNTFSYAVSFPNRVNDTSEKFTFSNGRELVNIIRDVLEDSFSVSKIKSLGESPSRYIETMDNVLSTYVSDGCLMVEIESGTTGSEINTMLTKILPIVHVALSVNDPKTDIVHQIAIGPKGNKVIKIRLLDRNFYNMTAVNQLKKLLVLDTSTFKAIKSIVEG